MNLLVKRSLVSAATALVFFGIVTILSATVTPEILPVSPSNWVTAGWIIFTAIASVTVGYVFNWWQNRQAESRQARRAQEIETLRNERDRATGERADLLERVGILERASAAADTALALLRQRATPLLEAAESRMIDMLTHPHPEFEIPDELLVQVRIDHIVTPQLLKLLKERETSDHPDVTNGEKLAAAALPPLSAVILVEKEAIEHLELVTQVVSSPAPGKKEKAA